MDKQENITSKIMRFIPKAATSSVSFQNPLPDKKRSSENNTSKFKAHYCGSGSGSGRGGKRFSGPIISIIPPEACGNATKEPTSPKVSCMGQVQHQKKIHNMKRRVAPTSQTHQQPKLVLPPPPKPQELKRQNSKLRIIFGRTKSDGSGRKSEASADPAKVLPQRAPSLGQMNRFRSGRGTLANFDWTAHQVAPVDSDEDIEDSKEEEKEVIIPFSEPILIGVALEPRKEINLWKRRTMAPPMPLQLNTLAI